MEQTIENNQTIIYTANFTFPTDCSLQVIHNIQNPNKISYSGTNIDLGCQSANDTLKNAINIMNETMKEKSEIQKVKDENEKLKNELSKLRCQYYIKKEEIDTYKDEIERYKKIIEEQKKQLEMQTILFLKKPKKIKTNKLNTDKKKF